MRLRILKLKQKGSLSKEVRHVPRRPLSRRLLWLLRCVRRKPRLFLVSKSNSKSWRFTSPAEMPLKVRTNVLQQRLPI